MKRQLEVCVGSTADVEAAAAGGADRVELCAATSVGGLTPSAATIAAAVNGSCPVHVLIRPREGGFTYDDQDETMRAPVSVDVDEPADAVRTLAATHPTVAITDIMERLLIIIDLVLSGGNATLPSVKLGR